MASNTADGRRAPILAVIIDTVENKTKPIKIPDAEMSQKITFIVCILD